MSDHNLETDKKNTENDISETPIKNKQDTTYVNEGLRKEIEINTAEKIDRWRNQIEPTVADTSINLTNKVISEVEQTEVPEETIQESISIEEKVAEPTSQSEGQAVKTEDKAAGSSKEVTTGAVDELLNHHLDNEEFVQQTAGINYRSDANNMNWEEPSVQPTVEEMNRPPYETEGGGYGNYQQNYSNGEIPYEIKRWNWGAFAFNIFWGIGNKTYLPLLCLIPVFNLVWVFICGAKGNEWAWQSGDYHSVEEFNRVQKSWNIAGIAKFVISLVLGLFMLLVIPVIIGFSAYFFEEFRSGYVGGYHSSYMAPYDDFEDYDDYAYSDIEISDIGKWTQEIFDSIQVADLEYDLKTDKEIYANGTKYEDLVKVVGAPVSTYNDGDTIEASWDTSQNDDDEYDYDLAYIAVNYDIKSGLIIDKSFSEE
ncbi:hypothetical protein IGI37_002905 [Enterococcus sp. AZ194]|uniref:hypothetical protein n=1 Tax=Enterococcus sp. AZ194 TaxID=2774629 RepID=UPI003F294843